MNQKVAARLLEKLDYRVHIVADGLQSCVVAWQTGDFRSHLDGFAKCPRWMAMRRRARFAKLEDGKAATFRS